MLNDAEALLPLRRRRPGLQRRRFDCIRRAGELLRCDLNRLDDDAKDPLILL
jgi:hypothetical protein